MPYNYYMDTKANTKAISEIAASQMGLFTSAQAARFDVSRNILAYMAKTGKIERLVHGVYRVSGAPASENQGIYAVWLSTNPAQMVYERIADFDGIVVGGRSAAALHDIGSFFLSPYRFLTRERINSKRQGIVFTKRFVDKVDVIFTDFGLPITSIARTIFDLRYDQEEPSNLAKTLADALAIRGPFEIKRLKALFIAASATRLGIGETDFEDLMNTVKG